jgi:hypothetical protein
VLDDKEELLTGKLEEDLLDPVLEFTLLKLIEELLRIDDAIEPG